MLSAPAGVSADLAGEKLRVPGRVRTRPDIRLGLAGKPLLLPTVEVVLPVT